MGIKLAQVFDVSKRYTPTKISAYIKTAGLSSDTSNDIFFNIDANDYLLSPGVSIDALNFENITQGTNKIITYDDVAGYSGNGFLRTVDPRFLRSPDIVVRGTLSPDATGEYFMSGQHNGQNYYVRSDGAYVVWFEPDPFTLDQWRISVSLDDDPVLWASPYNSVGALFGEYTAVEGTGQARVWSYVLNVEGSISPDATGTYFFAGDYNDYGCWEHNNGEWYIYWYRDWWQIADKQILDADIPPVDLVSWWQPIGWPPSPGSYIATYPASSNSSGDALVVDPLFLDPYAQYVSSGAPMVVYPIKSTVDAFPNTYNTWLRVRSTYGIFSAGIYLDNVLENNIYNTSVSSSWSWVYTTITIEDGNIKNLGIKIDTFGSEIDKIFISPSSLSIVPVGMGPSFNDSLFITLHAKIYNVDENNLPTTPLYIYDYKTTIEEIKNSDWYNFDINFLDPIWEVLFSDRCALVLFTSGTNPSKYLIWESSDTDEYMSDPSALLNK